MGNNIHIHAYMNVNDGFEERKTEVYSKREQYKPREGTYRVESYTTTQPESFRHTENSAPTADMGTSTYAINSSRI